MASSAASLLTPSPPMSVQTPPAPRLGFRDSWEPFTSRKSARISSQRAADRTPSPRPSRPQQQQPVSPRTATKSRAQSNPAMVSVSPVPSPRKKPHPANELARRRGSGNLTAAGTANAATVLSLGNTKAAQRTRTASISQANGMLPTPSKTPQKPPNEKTATTIQSFARNLFASDEEAIPSPQKRRVRKYSGVTMESFTAEKAEDSIEIFTDSQDRVPFKDESAENPFFGAAAVPEPRKRRGKCRLVRIPGEGPQSIDEASRREDGMVYVFRGKKFFRKFSDKDCLEPEEQETSMTDVKPELMRPLTRSSVKPRLLFRKKSHDANEDDEAVTDVEDAHMAPDVANPQTPKEAPSAAAKTPDAPKFAPVSPPDTKRATRSTNRPARSKTAAKSPSGQKSPFDAWLRTKEHRSPSVSKRQGEGLSAAATKRTRG